MAVTPRQLIAIWAQGVIKIFICQWKVSSGTGLIEAKGGNFASIYKLDALNRLKIKDNKKKKNYSKYMVLYMTLKIEWPIGKTIMWPQKHGIVSWQWQSKPIYFILIEMFS